MSLRVNSDASVDVCVCVSLCEELLSATRFNLRTPSEFFFASFFGINLGL